MTRTEIVQLSAPHSAPALRVWIEPDYARDYFVATRSWWVVSAENTFGTPPGNTSIAANSGVELLSAAIASSVTSSLRPILYPLSSDIRITPGVLVEAGTDSAKARFTESYKFLSALSNGQIPFTDNADSLAFQLIQSLHAEIRVYRAESQAGVV